MRGFVMQGGSLAVVRSAGVTDDNYEGVIFEEISTTHIKGDSTYADASIQKLDPMERKTVIEEW